MTKVRAPLTFSLAIATIITQLGKDECRALVDRSPSGLRNWGDSDQPQLPTLDQAMTLDLAFLAAGGGYAPIFESYERQLAIARCEPVVCRQEMARLLGAASREFGDAWAHCLQALQPDATPAQVHRAIIEIEEADVQIAPLIALFKALLPGNRARHEAMGEIG